jgi:hypothetical protein
MMKSHREMTAMESDFSRAFNALSGLPWAALMDGQIGLLNRC